MHNYSVFSFRCLPCAKSLSCGHMGRAAVTRHIQSDFHKLNKRAYEKTPSIQAVFPTSGSKQQDQVLRAEVKTVLLLAHHNIPLATMDHLSPLMHTIFPDSTSAKQFACARTKSTATLNGAIAPALLDELKQTLATEPFSVCTDGSNDNGLRKMNPIMTRFFKEGQVHSQLLDMGLTTGSTAEILFEKMDSVLTGYGLKWTNVVSIGVDNASVNMGPNNSIRSRALKKSPLIYMIRCSCHILHNTACKAGEIFSNITGFDVQDLMVDLYYYFDKSPKRKQELKEFAEYCDQPYRKIIKHVSTRWLSLETGLGRSLQQLPSLTSYFLSQGNMGKAGIIKNQLENPLTEIYLMFYQSALRTFTPVNVLLLRSEPLIAVLGNECVEFLKKLAKNFLKPAAILGKSITEIDQEDETNWKPGKGYVYKT